MPAFKFAASRTHGKCSMGRLCSGKSYLEPNAGAAANVDGTQIHGCVSFCREGTTDAAIEMDIVANCEKILLINISDSAYCFCIFQERTCMPLEYVAADQRRDNTKGGMTGQKIDTYIFSKRGTGLDSNIRADVGAKKSQVNDVCCIKMTEDAL